MCKTLLHLLLTVARITGVNAEEKGVEKEDLEGLLTPFLNV